MSDIQEKNTERRPSGGRRRRSRRPRNANANRPVPLVKRTGSHFQPGDRQRGQEYFHEGRVRMEVDGTRARAWVAGREQEVYGVGIDWSSVAAKRVLHVFCGCQRFADGKPCKHLRATLLALAESGPENHPPGRGRLGLRKDRATAWRELGVPAAEEKQPRRNSRRSSGRRQSAVSRRRAAPSWRTQLSSVREQLERVSGTEAAVLATSPPPMRGVRLFVNTAASLATGGLVFDLFEPRAGSGRNLRKLKRMSLDPSELDRLLHLSEVDSGAEPAAGADPAAEADSDSAAEATGSLPIVTVLPLETPNRQRGRRGPRKPPAAAVQRIRVPARLYEKVLPEICSRGIVSWWDGRSPRDKAPLAWDDGPAWRLALQLEIRPGGGARVNGVLERDGGCVPLSSPVLIMPTADGQGNQDQGPSLVVFNESIARLDLRPHHDLPWIALLRGKGEIVIPKEELEEALTTLLELPALPRLETPDELQLLEERATPQACLVLEADPAPAWMNPPLIAELSFDYGSLQLDAGDPRSAVVDWDGRRFLRRDTDSEHAALVRLLELGMQPVASSQGHGLELDPKDLPKVVEPLLLDGWSVAVHGATMRSPSPPALKVESGIDWFELSGEVDFAGDQVDLADVLDSIARGDRFIELDDGSKGLLPAAWMETYDSLAKLANESSDAGLRFLPSQALLVDALLTAMPPAVDQAFAKLRKKLSSFERIKPKKEPRGFDGTLRAYQREGLGWLNFLREFSLGGVLADDMGLGKTVQVLALMRAHRTPSKTTKLPFLVVAPRSVVYNWIDEAAHFAPKLRAVEYGGPDREALRDELGDYDLVVTTYGTLRRDIGYLATVEFDTVILDEAQAIKNPTSQTAKASRLLNGRYRLALTGTPIENHLGELGSLFEFLNPGLLGRMPMLDVLGSGRTPSKKELALVAEGIRPFILRRTKAQVLPDLPEKTEQVVFCTLGPRQREVYDQLRARYQASLLEQVESEGLSRSTMQVLEALLRLRQVACHPGLVDENLEEVGSAKLETLFSQVSEVLDEGHKLIIFSQFTKLLGFVQKHLQEQQVEYAYLDGQTRNRGEVVERFQTDPNCNLFLVSLKAGGTGLNLTAAGYVFLLDPWWNPAVEAQAIDRAHRIGQTQPVFAYRMIARDTVEEKILDLQRSKRQIADAILEGEGTSLSDLTADDLRMLLS
ncbi:MAG: SNF2-related protein [Acidobacteriota bacterium]